MFFSSCPTSVFVEFISSTTQHFSTDESGDLGGALRETSIRK